MNYIISFAVNDEIEVKIVIPRELALFRKPKNKNHNKKFEFLRKIPLNECQSTEAVLKPFLGQIYCMSTELLAFSVVHNLLFYILFIN